MFEFLKSKVEIKSVSSKNEKVMTSYDGDYQKVYILDCIYKGKDFECEVYEDVYNSPNLLNYLKYYYKHYVK